MRFFALFCRVTIFRAPRCPIHRYSDSNPLFFKGIGGRPLETSNGNLAQHPSVRQGNKCLLNLLNFY